MSLDARMQQIAREEAARLLGGADRGDDDGQLRDLHEHLHRALTLIDHLAARVDTLEKAAADSPETGAARTPQRRTKGRETAS